MLHDLERLRPHARRRDRLPRESREIAGRARRMEERRLRGEAVA